LVSRHRAKGAGGRDPNVRGATLLLPTASSTLWASSHVRAAAIERTSAGNAHSTAAAAADIIAAARVPLERS